MYKRIEYLLFCQALGDLTYCMTIVKDRSNYLIIVTLQSVFDIIFKNKIFDIRKIIYVPYPKSFRLTYKYFKIFFNTKKKLTECYFDNIYIFSIGFDWISLALLNSILDISGRIHYWNIYNNIIRIERIISIRSIIRTLYYFIHTGVIFKYYSQIGDRLVVVFNKEVFIQKNDSFPINNNYIVGEKNYCNKIVYVDSNSTSLRRRIDSGAFNNLLVRLCEFGYSIIVKKHPNFEYSFDFLKQYEIADNLPMELIDFSISKCIIGFESTAIVMNNCPLKISLIELFTSEDPDLEIVHYKNYLNHLDIENELKYPVTLNDLFGLLENYVE